MVKLFAKATTGDSSKALKALWTAIYEGDEASPPAPNRARVESTFTHLIDTIHDWDRLQYVSVFLLLDDDSVKFVDTNQLESVLRDIEVGTLTQTVTAAGKLGGKKTNYTAATVAGATSSLPVQELSPELSFSYVDALQRKLREQLNFRSASIESDGKIFRLVQRSSVENQIPSMTRQILTMQFRRQVELLRADFTKTGNRLDTLALKSYIQPQFCGMNAEMARDNFDVGYEVKATPFMLSAVRRIRNEKGVKTLGFDDDDRITNDLHLDVKPKTVLTTVPAQRWTMQVCKKPGDQPPPAGSAPTCYLVHAKSSNAEDPATVTFTSKSEASWFGAYLIERLKVISETDRREGHVLVGLSPFATETIRIGKLTGTKSVGFPDNLDPSSLQPMLYPFGKADDQGCAAGLVQSRIDALAAHVLTEGKLDPRKRPEVFRILNGVGKTLMDASLKGEYSESMAALVANLEEYVTLALLDPPRPGFRDRLKELHKQMPANGPFADQMKALTGALGAP